jgi:hypothetical protein
MAEKEESRAPRTRQEEREQEKKMNMKRIGRSVKKI